MSAGGAKARNITYLILSDSPVLSPPYRDKDGAKAKLSIANFYSRKQK
jgi:hypothetical protein